VLEFGLAVVELSLAVLEFGLAVVELWLAVLEMCPGVVGTGLFNKLNFPADCADIRRLWRLFNNVQCSRFNAQYSMKEK